MHKDSQYEQHPDTICLHILPSTSVWEVQPTYPPPRGVTDKGLKGGALRSYRERLCVLTESVSAPLPRASQRSYRERLSALTESVTALLPRASQRPYRERLSAPIMIVLALLLRGINQPQSAQPPRGLHPTLSDNNHVKTCCLTNISLTLVQESDLLVSVSVTGTGTDIMIALAVAYTPTGCTGSR